MSSPQLSLFAFITFQSVIHLCKNVHVVSAFSTFCIPMRLRLEKVDKQAYLSFTTTHATISFDEQVSKRTISESVSSVGDENTKEKIRPLHQNWWPVSIETSLVHDRPNSIELLGQKLVLYYDDSRGEEDNGRWNCLADRCSHRFAPLSEGRIIKGGEGCATCSIQCSYHGWEFDSNGKCIKVPQYPLHSKGSIDERKAGSVPSYPVREEAGMIWVWSDPNPATWDLANSIRLPISPLVRASYVKFGANACFMRDLPYGAELLGENLLDLAHVPFSHHSVGSLDRSMGTELPLRVMSEQERINYASWEEEFSTDGSTGHVIPLYQVEVQNASQTDPMILGMKKRLPQGVSDDAKATIAFFDPCHIRYRRERLPGSYSHVELFICPTKAGKSKVFLWNTFHAPPPKPKVDSLKDRVAKFLPISILKKEVLVKLMSPVTARSHLFAHAIFDGDGIFLYKQGNRMKINNLTFRNYATPSSADVLLNSYRRFLDAASKLSLEKHDSDAIGSAAAEAVSYQNLNVYTDDIPRSELLDRYNSHTKYCPVCSTDLERYKKKRIIYENIKTALIGAGGASIVALVTSLVSISVVPPPILRAAVLSTGLSLLASIGITRQLKKIEKKIQAFVFEDYVHAEKN